MLNLGTVDKVLMNAPVGVYFAGFISDTMTLQKAGWDLSIQQQSFINSPDPQITLAMRLPASGESLYAISHGASIRRWYEEIRRGNYRAYDSIEFHVQCMGSSPQVQYVTLPRGTGFQKFNSFNAIPFEVDAPTFKRIPLKDLVPFKTINPDSSEIWIPQDKVNEALERIIELQAPKQKEIRERERKEELRNANTDNIKAQIYVA